MSEQAPRADGELREGFVVFQTSQGLELRASLLRVTRFVVIFEIHSPTPVVRMSEVLTPFQIVANGKAFYCGKAVVSNLINVGAALVCEAKLDESAANLACAGTNGAAHHSWPERFANFLSEGQLRHRMDTGFKTVVADLQSFLTDLRLWLEQVELEICSASASERARRELEVIDELKTPVIRTIDTFIEQFETIAARLNEESVPAHRAYLRRHLHPLLLCSPFAYRTFQKPLGYAGDYEVVDMMIRPPAEGETLFAKIINVWLIGQVPAAAHRNRVEYLRRKLVEEAVRVQADGKMAHVFNLGCGPADEVQRFLREDSVSDRTSLTLVDFNEETLAELRQKLEGIKSHHQRRTPIHFIKKSVHQMLKEAARPAETIRAHQFDLVYCAGLFDYLSDQVCKKLVGLFYEMLAPGGLLLITNVSDAMNDSRPFRCSMEYILDWHLIYRDGPGVTALAPATAPEDSTTVIAEHLGVNVFLEVRKSRHA